MTNQQAASPRYYKHGTRAHLRCPHCHGVVELELDRVAILTHDAGFQSATDVGFRWMGGYFRAQPRLKR